MPFSEICGETLDASFMQMIIDSEVECEKRDPVNVGRRQGSMVPLIGDRDREKRLRRRLIDWSCSEKQTRNRTDWNLAERGTIVPLVGMSRDPHGLEHTLPQLVHRIECAIRVQRDARDLNECPIDRNNNILQPLTYDLRMTINTPFFHCFSRTVSQDRRPRSSCRWSFCSKRAS